jgi:glycosyltransferase involved in cell wall biosynthesis
VPHAARRPRLLFLAFFFPPSRGSGVYRCRAIANHFVRAGWDVTVVTAPREFFTEHLRASDPSLEATVDPAVRVERVPFNMNVFGIRDIRKIGALRANYPGLAALYQTEVRDRIFPERYGAWGMRALQRCAALHRKHRYDVVLASGNPFASFATAWAMHKRYRLPYVVDYRDAWTFNQFTSELKFPPEHAMWTWERRVLASAREIVFVNGGMRGWYAERYPTAAGRMTVVPNGWEPELLGEVPYRRAEPGQPLRFGYVGTVTEQMPLETLFAAWRKYRVSAPSSSLDQLLMVGHLGFFPHSALVLREQIRAEEHAGISYAGAVPKAELARTYADLDVLVFCVAGARYVTTGKVFEYMASGRPIVSVHEPEIAARDVLDGYPLWFHGPRLDDETAASAMQQAAAAARSSSPEVFEQARQHALRYTRDTVLLPLEERMRRYAAS